MKRFISLIIVLAFLQGSIYGNSMDNEEYKMLQEKMYLEMVYFDNVQLDLTRGELAYFAVSLYEYLVKDSAPDIVYSDNALFNDTNDFNVLRAHKLSIMNGYPEGSFLPDRKASYEECIVVLMKTIEKAEYSFAKLENEGSYNGVSQYSVWAHDSLNKVVNENIISPTELSLINARGYLTRNEFYKLLLKIVNEKRFVYDP